MPVKEQPKRLAVPGRAAPPEIGGTPYILAFWDPAQAKLHTPQCPQPARTVQKISA
jgi:hypothetical protein